MKMFTGKYKKLSAGIMIASVAFGSMAFAQTSLEEKAAGQLIQSESQQQAEGNNSSVVNSTASEKSTQDTSAPFVDESAATDVATTAPVFTIQKPTATLPQTARVNSGASLVNLALGLGFILLLIFALAWLARRMGQGGLLNNNHIKIVAAMPLGTRERLLVVDVAGQQLLLGITATQINTLHVFAEPVIDKAQMAGNSEFGKKLMAILQQKTAEQPIQSDQNKELR